MFMGASTKKGYDIASKSRKIVRSLIENKIRHLSPQERSIIERIVHSTADTEYADITKMSGDFVSESIDSIVKGKDILTDINMVKVGINKYFGDIKCYINHENTVELAQKENITRTAAAMKIAMFEGFEGIVVIGNSPTALFEVLNLVEDHEMKVQSVVGVPVGFVGAAESKKALQKSKIPHLVTEGPKGGTPVAVAVVNSLINLKKEF
ncbi:MAG: cobalt-precorrin-8 methylmutase [Euryarchaeota archaeon]|nr:cobalt-precorrin-8 methylmutase [Euryarchaeota archaeon]